MISFLISINVSYILQFSNEYQLEESMDTKFHNILNLQILKPYFSFLSIIEKHNKGYTELYSIFWPFK